MKKNLNLNQNFSSFRPIFDFELSGKRSRAEPKIFQLELWLEPARLGLITLISSVAGGGQFETSVKSWLGCTNLNPIPPCQGYLIITMLQNTYLTQRNPI